MNLTTLFAIFLVLALHYCDATLFKDRPRFKPDVIKNSKQIEIPRNAPLKYRKSASITDENKN
jgi:hypothetical protein